MKYLLTLFLFAGLLAGCSGALTPENATRAGSPVGNRDIVSPTNAPTLEATKMDATSAPKPMSIKVNPPKIPIGSASTPLQGWQTFTSPTLGVTVDYPADWSAIENDAGVKFTSSQGQLILLQVDQSNGSVTGPDCTTLINSYGQSGSLCFDAATSTYRAAFKKTADASAPVLILSTISTEKPTVYLQMFNLFRFTP